jgi:hypothetical protein
LFLHAIAQHWPRLQCAASHRRSSVTSCQPSSQRRKLQSVTSHRRNVTNYRALPAIATMLRIISHRCSVALLRTVVQRHRSPSQQRRLISARLTSVRLSSNFRHVVLCHVPLHPNVLCVAILHPIVLPSYFSSDICLTFIRPSLDVRLTSVRHLFSMGHSQRHTVFFKPYVMLKKIS